MLEEVVVQGDRLRDGADRYTFTPKPDTAYLLEQAPGVSIAENGPLSAMPSYRGMSSTRVAVLLDGAQIIPSGPNWMDPPLSYVSSANVARIRLYRGLAPVSVAPETLGGAVVVDADPGEFADALTPELRGRIHAGAQDTGRGFNTYATTTLSSRKHLWRLAGLYQHSSDLEFPGGEITPTEYQRKRYEFGYGYQNGPQEWRFNYMRNDTADAGVPALAMDIAYFTGDFLNLSRKAVNRRGSVLTTSVYGSRLEHAMTNYHLRPRANPGRWRRSKADLSNLGFKVQMDLQGKGGVWKLGIDGLQAVHNVDVDNPNNPDFFISVFNQAERRIVGVFSEYLRHLGAWEIDLGIRYNHVVSSADAVDGTPAQNSPAAAALLDGFNSARRRRTDHNWDAVAKLHYQVNPQFVWYAGVGRKSRAPSYQERYLWLPLGITGGRADGFNYVGDVTLSPEIAYEGEFGFDLGADTYAVSAGFFYRRVRDYIQGILSASTAPGISQSGPLQFANVDAELFGADVEWRYQISARWLLNGQAGYVRGRRTDISDELYRLAPFNTSLALSYGAGPWQVQLTGRWVSRQNKVSGVNREQPSSGYAVAKVQASWQVSPRLRLVLGADNLFQRRYADHLGGIYRVSANPHLAAGEKIPAGNRSFYAQVSYQFGEFRRGEP